MNKIISVSVYLLFFSIGCGFFSESTSSDKGSKAKWKSAGLQVDPQQANRDGSGFQKIIAVGEHLFVMNNLLKEGGNWDYRIFTTIHGSSDWDSLFLPERLSPFSWTTDGTNLYVGTGATGQIFKYAPTSKEWSEIQTGIKGPWSVLGLSYFNNGLLRHATKPADSISQISFMNFDDSNWNEIVAQSDTGQINWEGFIRTVEHQGALYMTTWGHGLWKWSGGENPIEQLPLPEAFMSNSTREYSSMPRGLTVFEDRVTTGFQYIGRIRQWLGTDWTELDSCIAYYPDVPYPGVHRNCNTPYSTHALVNWDDKLIAAGIRGGTPMLYTGASEAKGWRAIAPDSYDDSETWDMVVVGNTLYAAGWTTIWKFDLRLLEEAIEDSAPYLEYPTNSEVVY
jgi:hypothetical protein